jgi:hypothetical protein
MADAPAKEKAKLVVRGDLNRLSWPPLRSDVVAVACLGVLVYCVLAHRWPLLAFAALFGGVFAGLSPRMKGPFGFHSGTTGIGGEFASPFDELTQADAEQGLVLGPPPKNRPPPEPPPKTGSV